jgi:hypothetical protein
MADDTKAPEFMARHKAKFDVPPDDYSICAYNAGW